MSKARDLSQVVNPIGAEKVGYTPVGAGAVVIDVESKLSELELSTSEYSTYQQACNAIVSGSVLKFPAGTHTLSNYLTISGKSNFTIAMDGIVVPTGTMNDVNTGLFHLVGCSNFTIIPNIKNPDYASTINLFKLDACTDWQIVNGVIDVKYVGYDGTAAIQLGTNTKRGRICNNFIRAGYGILQNDVSGVDGICIYNNEFFGQKVYGSLGTGDAIEFNGPTNYATEVRIHGNRFSGYEVHNPGGFDARVIVVGLSNTKGFSIDNNTFDDCESENIHLEDGASKGTIIGNRSNGGVMGINITPNSDKDLSDIVISNNSINLFAQPSGYVTDYSAAILCNTNSVSTGKSVNIVISNNKCTGNNLAQRGICLYDVDGFVLSGNLVRDFPRAGFDLRKFPGLGTGLSNGIVEGNQSILNGWNYIIGGVGGVAGPLTNIRFDESNLSTGSLFGLDYNSEITTRTGCVIRIPYASGSATRKLTAGDHVVFSDGTSQPVVTSGVAGVWKSAGGVIEWSKAGSGTSAVATVTFANYPSANISTIVEVWASDCAANAASYSVLVEKFVVIHSNAVVSINSFGTNDSTNSGGAATITPTISGLSAIFTATFVSGFTNNLSLRISQANIYDQTLGGVESIS